MDNTWSKLIMRLFFSFLAMSLIAMGIIHGQDPSSKAKTMTVTSFESPQDLQEIRVTNAKVSLTTEHVTDGKSALKVEFSGAGPTSIGFPSGAQPWDWHEDGAIAFDVTNPTDEEIRVDIQLSETSSGPGPNREVGGHGNVGPHDTVSYYYPIGPTSPLAHGMRGGPPAIRGIDLLTSPGPTRGSMHGTSGSSNSPSSILPMHEPSS